MKFSVSMLTLVLFLLFNVNDSNAQAANSELEKLEAQLKLLDQAGDSVQVKVKGDKETSGTISFTVEREWTVATINKNNTIIGTSDTKKRKVDLPAVDLSKVNVSDEYINERIKASLTKPTCGTLPGVVLSQVGVGRDYMVLEDYTYNAGSYSIIVPREFTYDRASIPRILWVIIDKDSLGNVAPLIHDFLYRNGGVLPQNQVSPYRRFSREDTDKLFLELMEKCGVSKVRRLAAYQAVKRFGESSWQRPGTITNAVRNTAGYERTESGKKSFNN
jgi:hypothetical protein